MCTIHRRSKTSDLGGFTHFFESLGFQEWQHEQAGHGADDVDADEELDDVDLDSGDGEFGVHHFHEAVVEEAGEPLGKRETDVHDAGDDGEIGGFSLAGCDKDGELEERDIGDHEEEFAEG